MWSLPAPPFNTVFAAGNSSLSGTRVAKKVVVTITAVEVVIPGVTGS